MDLNASFGIMKPAGICMILGKSLLFYCTAIAYLVKLNVILDGHKHPGLANSKKQAYYWPDAFNPQIYRVILHLLLVELHIVGYTYFPIWLYNLIELNICDN